MKPRIPSFSELIFSVAKFYHWTAVHILDEMKASEFWAALEWMVEYRREEARANKADPLGSIDRRMREAH